MLKLTLRRSRCGSEVRLKTPPQFYGKQTFKLYSFKSSFMAFSRTTSICVGYYFWVPLSAVQNSPWFNPDNSTCMALKCIKYLHDHLLNLIKIRIVTQVAGCFVNLKGESQGANVWGSKKQESYTTTRRKRDVIKRYKNTIGQKVLQCNITKMIEVPILTAHKINVEQVKFMEPDVRILNFTPENIQREPTYTGIV